MVPVHRAHLRIPLTRLLRPGKKVYSFAMPSEQFPDHLDIVQARWARALENCGFDAAVVAAGQSKPYFLDDQSPPFRANPHFAQMFPSADCEGSMLFLAPGRTPVLLFLQPCDYWHKPPDLPDWAGVFDVEVFASDAQLGERVQELIASQSRRVAYVGEMDTGNLPGTPNPAELLYRLHYERAAKTSFELDSLRAAARRAAAGHRAAESRFREGAGEFQIHMAYLAAAEHTAEELPYSSIVALNAHAGILHYQHYERQPPANRLSFLIDAGAAVNGYAADVTRTYAADSGGLFADLVEQLDAAQQALITTIRPGQNYLDLHVAMHRALGGILAQNRLVTCSGEAAFELGITEIFLPHGLGHLIGLQTHDVGGLQKDPAGTQNPPPERYQALRLTREIIPDMVFTIEPGIYFIPALLKQLGQSSASSEVDWTRVNSLVDHGGIRIEDNVRVTASGCENFTRDAFAGLSAESPH